MLISFLSQNSFAYVYCGCRFCEGSIYSTETSLPENDERQRGMSEKPATTMTEGEANELIQAPINADETLDETGGMRPVDAYDVNENKKTTP